MTLTKQWAIATAEQAAVVFAAAFVGALVLAGSGAFNLSALHSAAVGGGAAVLSFLQSVLAGLLTPKPKPANTNLLTAIRTFRHDQAGQVTLRLLFAIVAIIAGIVVLVRSNSDTTLVAAGVGLIAAGIATVVP